MVQSVTLLQAELPEDPAPILYLFQAEIWKLDQLSIRL